MLRVDLVGDSAELEAFERQVVRGPGPDDCALWTGAIGGDGYGRLWIRRGGQRVMVRANRYALAASLPCGLGAGVLALHGCDVPLCVRVGQSQGTGLVHVFGGSQANNMVLMGRAGRGGGRRAIRRGPSGRLDRKERSMALRAAVEHGWNQEAVERALAGPDPTLW